MGSYPARFRSMRAAIVRSFAFALAASFAIATAASAQAPDTGGASAVEFAAAEYQRGYQAYTKRDYEAAATHFENAFFSAPNSAVLRRAIRARRDARHYARAATLAALAHRKYADDQATKK